MMTHAKTTRMGFTLIELLVAVSLTILVVGIINQLFNSTTRAVTAGVQLGDIMSNQRALGEQFREDAERMVAPEPMTTATTDGTGLLVIFNNTVNRGGAGVHMPDPGNVNETTFTPIRSDQLMFIGSRADTSGLVQTLAPSTSTGYAGHGDHQASFSKIWFGHVQLTNEDGSVADGLDSTNNGPNYNGWQWVLGRQELFLTDSATSTPPGSVAGINHVDGIVWNATLGGGYGSFPESPAQNWHGLTDVSDVALSPTFAPTAGEPVLFGPSGYGSAYLVDGLTQADYQTRAYALMFPTSRLQANASPQPNYDPWRIAQMYPYYMQGVSDFIVEFAADANNDGFVDVDSDGDLAPNAGTSTGEIVWYSSFNPPDTAPFDFSAYDPTSATPPLPADARDPYNDAPGLAHAGAAFVWRHDYPDNWPYLIRIRYRLHDGRGGVRSTQDTSVSAAAPTPTTNITEQVSGRWFEVIIPVNRP